MFNKLFFTGLALISLGILSAIIEEIFYGNVDENNILQESFFLPLSFLLIFIGLLLFIFNTIKTNN
jgi:hypothetical protein